MLSSVDTDSSIN